MNFLIKNIIFDMYYAGEAEPRLVPNNYNKSTTASIFEARETYAKTFEKRDNAISICKALNGKFKTETFEVRNVT